jgi:glycosidase
MPLTYSGQEALNPRQLQFFDKDEINWQPTEMNDLYKMLNKLKSDYSVLHNGTFGGLITKITNSSPYQIYSISRNQSDEEVIFIINLSNETQQFTLQNIDGAYSDYITSDIYDIDQYTSLVLNPWEFIIMVK